MDNFILNLVIFDEFNAPVLHIKNNQLYYSTEPWDIQLVGTRLAVREAHRKILIEIDFQPPNKVVINRGRFLRNGVEILVRPSNILVTNNATLICGCRAHNCHGGLIVGHHEQQMGALWHLEAFLGILVIDQRRLNLSANRWLNLKLTNQVMLTVQAPPILEAL